MDVRVWRAQGYWQVHLLEGLVKRSVVCLLVLTLSGGKRLLHLLDDIFKRLSILLRFRFSHTRVAKEPLRGLVLALCGIGELLGLSLIILELK